MVRCTPKRSGHWQSGGVSNPYRAAFHRRCSRRRNANQRPMAAAIKSKAPGSGTAGVAGTTVVCADEFVTSASRRGSHPPRKQTHRSSESASSLRVRRRRIRPKPSKPAVSKVSDVGSGVVIGVMVPVKLPSSSNVSAVINAVEFVGSRSRLGLIPSTSNLLLRRRQSRARYLPQASYQKRMRCRPMNRVRMGLGCRCSAIPRSQSSGFLPQSGRYILWQLLDRDNRLCPAPPSSRSRL